MLVFVVMSRSVTVTVVMIMIMVVVMVRVRMAVIVVVSMLMVVLMLMLVLMAMAMAMSPTRLVVLIPVVMMMVVRGVLQFHELTRREVRDAIGDARALCRRVAGAPIGVDGLADLRDQLLGSDGLPQEVDGAGLERPNRRGDVGIAGHDDDR